MLESFEVRYFQNVISGCRHLMAAGDSHALLSESSPRNRIPEWIVRGKGLRRKGIFLDISAGSC